MKKMIIYIFIGIIGTSPAYALPKYVLLMRHAEKPAEGNELSPQGWERAKALPELFRRSDFAAFGSPQALIAMGQKKNSTSQRAIETLSFLAKAINLPIQDDYNRGDEKDVADLLATAPELDQKVVVVCWEHNGLEQIAKNLGFKPKPQWPGDQYDRVWVISFSKDGTPELADLPEKLLPGDSAQ
jgi:hypothetical protein